jgi:predicted amidohydrolase
MNDTVKIAGIQMDPKLMAKEENLAQILSGAEEAAKSGAQLIVFPECALTGYVFSSRQEAAPFAETIPGGGTETVAGLCRRLNVHVVFGLLEKDGDKHFNAAALIGPQGIIGKYRKVHLPYLGVDRFLDPGDGPFAVYKTDIGVIGIHICYDCNFPETARVMALQEADILVLPTNWPNGRGKIVEHVVVTRAFENKVHLAAVDRVGVERGVKFLGRSKIIDAWGNTLCEGSADNEEIICADVKLSDARAKRIIFKPGEFELDFINDRRPECYGEIVRAKSR